MEKLKNFIFGMPSEQREDFAARCGTSFAHMRNVAYGYRRASEKLSVRIERESEGAVTRKDLYPSEWPEIWPELKETSHA
ncbi:helix-turn-helix domain-containing protein [Alcaligenaceae bacterium]|nr:helix-turn-helix domain-containing protein [Alcaligenaceae bacterium]